MNLIIRVINEIPNKFRIKLFFISFLVLISSFVEILSIGAIYPVVSSLFSGNANFNEKLYIKIVEFFPLFNNFNVNSVTILIVVIFILFSLFSSFLRMFLLNSSINFSYMLGNEISSEIFKITLNKDYNYHVNQNSNEFIANIFHNTYSFIKITNYILNIFSSSLISIIILIFLLIVNPIGTLVLVLSFILMYIFISHYTKKKLYSYGLVESIEVGEILKLLRESFGSIREVIIRNLQKYYVAEYKNKDMSLRSAQSKADFYTNFPRYFMDPIAIIILVVLALILSLQSTNSANNLSVLAIFVFSGQRLFPLFHQVYSSISGIRSNSSNVIKILNILESRKPFSTGYKITKNIIFSNKLELIDISYGHKINDLILDNVSLNINQGDFVAFVGKTGVGKTTLFDIISLLLQPHSGRIMVNGSKIDSINAYDWQKKIAYVPQHIHLFDSTIAENVATGVPLNEINFERLKYVCELTCLNEFINSLPNAYLSNVGEGGAQLSGGQKQRIGLARALYSIDVEILFLDEPTSALDPATERRIITSLSSLSNITILMITHREETLQMCDAIYELRDKKLFRLNK